VVQCDNGLQPPQDGGSTPRGRGEGSRDPAPGTSARPSECRCCSRQQSALPSQAGYWFLWLRCPACRTINAIDLRGLDRHPDAAVSSLIPALSCRSCPPNAPFARAQPLKEFLMSDIFAAIRRASSLLSSLAADRRNVALPCERVRELFAFVGQHTFGSIISKVEGYQTNVPPIGASRPSS